MPQEENLLDSFIRINKKNEWNTLYQNIRSESVKNASSCTEALKIQNKIYNRYRDVSPYDETRIVLSKGSTNYINASLLKVEKAHRSYILTQGPLPNTISHFWLMIWEQKSAAILMLNKLIEKKQEKCCQYWPAKIGQDHILKLPDVGLTVEYLELVDHSYFLTRKFQVTEEDSNESRIIIQFHYTTWPDFGVPTSPTAFLAFLKHVRDAGVLNSDVGPAVVHCSAGIGRSGTFCLVDSCLVLIEQFGFKDVNIKDVLLDMRKYRMGLIQTPEQLRFSYQAIIEGTKHHIANDPKLEEEYLSLLNNDTAEVLPRTIDHISDDDDEPPPLPPPRLDSLHCQNGSLLEKPLPKIPVSVSLNELNNVESFEQTKLLPVVPDSEEEQIAEDSSASENEPTNGVEEIHETNSEDTASPTETAADVRRRKRAEQKETLEARVSDMKRRQIANEKWIQLKRSLYKALFICGAFIVGGGLSYHVFIRLSND